MVTVICAIFTPLCQLDGRCCTWHDHAFYMARVPIDKRTGKVNQATCFFMSFN